jgi:hypothetical protein
MRKPVKKPRKSRKLSNETISAPIDDIVEHDCEADADEEQIPTPPVAGPESRTGGPEKTGAWRVAKALEMLRSQINVLAPNRSKVSDGGIGDPAHQSRKSDHNPWVKDKGIGVVTARDFTHDPAHDCDAGLLAESLRKSKDPRVKYVIWNRKIFTAAKKGGIPGWTWRPYSGSNPHNKHVHVSVQPSKSRYDDQGKWTIRIK